MHTSDTCLKGVKELSEALQISEPTLSKVLQLLTKRKFILSKKGRNGGFYMSDEQKNDTLMNVLLNMENSDYILTDCMLGQKKCDGLNNCPYHERVLSIRKEFQTIYNSDTIENTAKKIFYKRHLIN
jgi:Rrf2 family protein